MGTQLLALVAGYHVDPGLDHLVLLGHLVAEFALVSVGGQHDEVVDALLCLFYRGVVGMSFGLLAVHHGKHRVGWQAQRQIDGLLRVVGYRLGLSLRATVHQVDNLLRLGGDNLRQQLLLRVDELRLNLRSVAQGHVANQVEGVALLFHILVEVHLLALGNLHQGAVLVVLADFRRHGACALAGSYLVEHLLGHGTDGRHRRHHHVLHATDIEVGIGTHHRRVAAGANVVANDHRVREGLRALCVVHQEVNVGIPCVGIVDGTHRGTNALWR